MLVPSLKVELADGAADFMNALTQAASMARGISISSEGEAASYALVWELGNLRQTKKGPKTVRGVNLKTGDSVWLSSQAPTGYVRVNASRYVDSLTKALGEVEFASLLRGEGSTEIDTALGKAGKDSLELIRATVPVDSGALQGSLTLEGPDDLQYSA